MPNIRKLSIKEFKTILDQQKKGNENAKTDNVLVAKGFDCEVLKQTPEQEAQHVLTFVISTDAVDRDGDTLNVEGWDLKNFKKNGPVLWAHNSSMPPIAKALKTYVEDGKLKSDAQFTTKDLYPFGDTIYQMYKEGFMNATSVGFIPKDFKISDDDKRGGFMPTDFIKQELIEYSAVPVPSNPEALIEMRSKGIDLEPYREWVDGWVKNENKTGVWIKAGLAKELYEALKTTTIVDLKGDPVISDSKNDGESVTSPAQVAVTSGEDENKTIEDNMLVGEMTINIGDQVQEDLDKMAKLVSEPVTGDVNIVIGATEEPDSKLIVETISTKAIEKDLDETVDDVVDITQSSLELIYQSINKAGRVLSATNEDKIRNAHTLLDKVLAQLDKQEDDKDVSNAEDKQEEEDKIIIKLEDEEEEKEEDKIIIKLKEETIKVNPDVIEEIIERKLVERYEETITPLTGELY